MKPLHPRAVIDTNVLLDFWVFDDAASRPLRAAVESGQVNALRSGDSVDEFTQVIMREQFELATEARFGILRDWTGSPRPSSASSRRRSRAATGTTRSSSTSPTRRAPTGSSRRTRPC